MRNWDLLREMSQMQRNMDEALRGLGHLFGPAFEPALGLRSWPRINLREDGEHLYVEALLPGVDPDKIDMNVLGNTLTLSGERLPADAGGTAAPGTAVSAAPAGSCALSSCRSRSTPSRSGPSTATVCCA